MAQKRIERLLNQTKTDPNVIWQTRRKTKANNDLPYDTVTEDGEVLTEAESTKEYIADYFEQLYQARPGTNEYKEWTQKIYITP